MFDTSQISWHGRREVSLTVSSRFFGQSYQSVQRVQGSSGCVSVGGSLNGCVSAQGILLCRQPHSLINPGVVSMQALSSIRHGWLIQEISDEVLRTAKEAGVHQICPRANACTREGVDAARDAGFTVRGWGVKSLQVNSHFLSYFSPCPLVDSVPGPLSKPMRGAPCASKYASTLIFHKLKQTNNRCRTGAVRAVVH
jgi:hypothetical protein